MAKMTIKQRLSIIADGRHLNLADIVAADALAEIKRLESIIRKIKCPASPPDVEAISPLDESAIRRDEREKCISDLKSSYPDHAWLNAACAAIRSRNQGK
jgi:hypothetical protein